MTRGDLVERVSLVSGLSDAAASEERGLLEDWANEAVVQTLLDTSCFVQEGQTTLTSGENHYTGDASILLIRDWQFPDISDYERVTVDEARDLYRTGSYRKVFAMEFRDFWINPSPSSNIVASFTFVPKPSPMTDDAHDPAVSTYGGIETQYHKALEYYMLWQAALYDEKKLPQSASDYEKLYDGKCRQIRQEGRRAGGRMMRRMRVGYPASTINTRRNDVHP